MTLTRLREVSTIETEAPKGPGFFYDHNVRGLIASQSALEKCQARTQPLRRKVQVTMNACGSVQADKTWADLSVTTTGGRESEG